mgnify:CR=1 FL=1
MGVAWALLGGTVVYGVLKMTLGLKMSQEEEYEGADLTVHKISATPDREVKVLACPASAPWLKIGDVMDYITTVKPKSVFPTHNIHLSEQGNQLNNNRIKQVTEENGGSFEYHLPGDSFEL